jgi:hypothetical protein
MFLSLCLRPSLVNVRSEVQVASNLLAWISESNSSEVMDVCLSVCLSVLCECRVLPTNSLRRPDPSSRGVLPSVCVCVCVSVIKCKYD